MEDLSTGFATNELDCLVRRAAQEGAFNVDRGNLTM